MKLAGGIFLLGAAAFLFEAVTGPSAVFCVVWAAIYLWLALDFLTAHKRAQRAQREAERRRELAALEADADRVWDEWMARKRDEWMAR